MTTGFNVFALSILLITGSLSAQAVFPSEYQPRALFHVPTDGEKNVYKAIIDEVRTSEIKSIVTVSWYQLGSDGGFDNTFSVPFSDVLAQKEMTLRGNIGSSKKDLPSSRVRDIFRQRAHAEAPIEGIKFYGSADPGPNSEFFNHQKIIAISPDKVIISSLNFTDRDAKKYGVAVVLRSKILHDRMVEDIAAQRVNYETRTIPTRRRQLLIGEPIVLGTDDTQPLKYERSPIDGRDPISDFLKNIEQGLGSKNDAHKGRLVIVVPRIINAAIAERISRLAMRPDVEITIVSRFGLKDDKGKLHVQGLNILLPIDRGYQKNNPTIHAKYAAYSGSWGEAKKKVDVVLHGTANFTKSAWTKQQEATIQILGHKVLTKQFMDFAKTVRKKKP